MYDIVCHTYDSDINTILSKLATSKAKILFLPIVPTTSYMMSVYDVMYDFVGHTYDIVYDVVKTYHIVGQNTDLANSSYDIVHDIVCFSTMSYTICSSYVGILRYHMYYDNVCPYRPKPTMNTYDEYIQYHMTDEILRDAHQ
jgi:hypothetical protein